ncbi:MAG: glycosyltransferase [Kiritimatiellae bacterium]|nr:glycosyltransferase [Kiritimatiellia bacterium]
MADLPRIALWFRYGPAEHTELFHAMPEIVEALAQHAEVHYFGMTSDTPVPETIRRNAIIHTVVGKVDRTHNQDKHWKTLRWLIALPKVARTCRDLGVKAVYIDETIPLTASIALRYFGPNVAITVADFFVDIYLMPHRLLRPLARWIRRKDLEAWGKLPLIFTRAKATRAYLASQGIPADHIRPVYDPCDHEVFHPLDKAACKKAFGYGEDDVVLVHHGILHPNKGNDRILSALARNRERLPHLRYLLVGDGPDMPRLKAMVRELALESIVQLTGWLPGRADVNRALNAGDIGLVMRVGHQSDDFHMTGALVHSMACGLPILAARLGGVSEVVHDDRNGFLFDPVCTDEFDQRLIELAEDAALRTRLGSTAHADSLVHFSMEAVTSQTMEPLLALAGLSQENAS